MWFALASELPQEDATMSIEELEYLRMTVDSPRVKPLDGLSLKQPLLGDMRDVENGASPMHTSGGGKGVSTDDQTEYYDQGVVTIKPSTSSSSMLPPSSSSSALLSRKNSNRLISAERGPHEFRPIHSISVEGGYSPVMNAGLHGHVDDDGHVPFDEIPWKTIMTHPVTLMLFFVSYSAGFSEFHSTHITYKGFPYCVDRFVWSY